MLLDMRYQNRHVDTHVMGGSNIDVRFVIICIFKLQSTITVQVIIVYIVLWPEVTRYMACDGSSRLSVGMSVQPRWDSLSGINWDKIICYLSSFLMNKFLARINITQIKRVSMFVMFYQELELEMSSYDITIRV